ncbi:MAG TPA: wax ester/triacylglycerol synthase domain-containing protein [Caldimonas sp.]
MNPDPIPPPAPERMSRVDTAWLRMDNDVNLMMIVGVWLLRPALAYEALCARVEEKLLLYGRFRQKVIQDATGASWVHDPAFDIHRHVVRERLRRAPRESERAALQRRAGELANTPLSSDHALWQFHLIEGYEGGSALVARVHHCIGDGIALISVMLSITDGGADPPKRKHRAAAGESGE